MEVGGVQHPQDVLPVLRRGQQDLGLVIGELQTHHPLPGDIQRIDEPEPRHVRNAQGVAASGGGGVAVQLHWGIPQAEALRRPLRLGVCVGGKAHRGQKAVLPSDGEGGEAILRVERGVAGQIHLVVCVVIESRLHPVRLPHGDTELVEGGIAVGVVVSVAVPQQRAQIPIVRGQEKGIGVVELPQPYQLGIAPAVAVGIVVPIGLIALDETGHQRAVRLLYQRDIPPVGVEAVVEFIPLLLPVVETKAAAALAVHQTVGGVPRVVVYVVNGVPAQLGAVLDGGAEAQTLRRRDVAPCKGDGVGQGGGGAVQPQGQGGEQDGGQHQHRRRSRQTALHPSSPASPSVSSPSARLTRSAR